MPCFQCIQLSNKKILKINYKKGSIYMFKFVELNDIQILKQFVLKSGLSFNLCTPVQEALLNACALYRSGHLISIVLYIPANYCSTN